MVRTGFLAGLLALLALTASAAGEQRAPGSGGITFKPLVRPQSLVPPPVAAATPYPMTYSEQVAQSLGVRDGGLALTRPSGRDPHAPSLSFTGSMLRLQWRP